MIEDEWKKMERVIPVAPWTYLDMTGDKRGRVKWKEGMKMKETNEQVTQLEMKEQAR